MALRDDQLRAPSPRRAPRSTRGRGAPASCRSRRRDVPIKRRFQTRLLRLAQRRRCRPRRSPRKALDVHEAESHLLLSVNGSVTRTASALAANSRLPSGTLLNTSLALLRYMLATSLHVVGRHGLGLGIVDAERVAGIVMECLPFGEVDGLVEVRLQPIEVVELQAGLGARQLVRSGPHASKFVEHRVRLGLHFGQRVSGTGRDHEVEIAHVFVAILKHDVPTEADDCRS